MFPCSSQVFHPTDHNNFRNYYSAVLAYNATRLIFEFTLSPRPHCLDGCDPRDISVNTRICTIIPHDTLLIGMSNVAE